MKKWLAFLSIILVAAIVFAGCSQQTQAPPAKSSASASTPASAPKSTQTSTEAKILKFSYDMPKTSGTGQAFDWFAQQVPIRTNGKYKVDEYPGGSLFKSAESLNSVQAGVADLANASVSSNAKAVPISSVVFLPSVHFPPTKEGMIAATTAHREIMAKYPVMANEWKNYKQLGWCVGASFIPASKKVKVVVPDDLKGLKVACGASDQNLIKMMGGVPVMIGPPDMYQAIDKGVVDAAIVGWEQLHSERILELTNYFLNYGFGNLVQTVNWNLNSWNSLPPDIQKIFTDLMRETELKGMDLTLEQSKLAVSEINAAGGKVITAPTPDQMKLWDNYFAAQETAWLDTMKASGVTDAPAILSYLKQKSAEAWAQNK